MKFSIHRSVVQQNRYLRWYLTDIHWRDKLSWIMKVTFSFAFYYYFAPEKAPDVVLA